MSDISDPTSNMPSSTQAPPPTPDEIAAMEALYKITKATDTEITSVAPWLLKEFTTHKSRLIKGIDYIKTPPLKKPLKIITIQLPKNIASTPSILTN